MPGPPSCRTRRRAANGKGNAAWAAFVRSSWDEVNQMIAAANVYTIKQYGPDRVIGFSPIRPCP